jgi:type VI secretion system ImpB/VipA family protein
MPDLSSFEFAFKSAQQQPTADALPMHILLLDNFSGHRDRSLLQERPFVAVDIDNFDQVITRYAPQLDLDLSGTVIHLEFRTLDDFHPDTLFRNVPLFASLREQLKSDFINKAPVATNAVSQSPPDNPFQSLLGGEEDRKFNPPKRSILP